MRCTHTYVHAVRNSVDTYTQAHTHVCTVMFCTGQVTFVVQMPYHCNNCTCSAEQMLNFTTDTVSTYIPAWSALDTAVDTHSQAVFGEYTVTFLIHPPTTTPTHSGSVSTQHLLLKRWWWWGGGWIVVNGIPPLYLLL